MKKYLLSCFIIVIIVALYSCREEKTKNYNRTNYDETLIKINKYLIKEDAERIESFIERKKWDMKQSETGLCYQIYENGDNAGELAKKGDIATLNFRVELLDGTLCYSSDSTGAKKFKIAFSDVESGLNEGMRLLKVGDKARFIMPPYMAHGLLGDDYKIPPRAIILYDIEVLDIESIN